nr:YfiR/HmsC family protein [Marinifaba aquimaris]
MLLPFTKLSAAELPHELQAVLLSKILIYERQLKEKSSLSVFVLDDASMFDAFSRLAQAQQSGVSFSNVVLGNKIPGKAFDLIYVNDNKRIKEAIDYANTHGVIIATGKANFVQKGITLGIGVEKGKPQFYLNLTTSLTSGLKWEQNILQVVKTFQ